MSADPHIKPSMAILPILFGTGGLVYICYLMWNELSDKLGSDPSQWLTALRLDTASHAPWYIGAAILIILVRDLCGIHRYDLLTDGKMTFWQRWRVRMLCEFTNAATPSAAGGGSLEMVFFWKEGIPISKGASIAILGVIFDELFFILGFVALCILLPIQDIFSVAGAYSQALLGVFMLSYSIKFIWVCLLCYGVFVNPQAIGGLIRWVFSWRILKRWQFGGFRTSRNIENCSREFRQKPFRYWVRLALTSCSLWTCRFLVVNCLIMAFNPLSFWDNIMVFARQLTTMVVMLVTPTPGGSGFIEVLFKEYLGEFIVAPISVIAIVLLWRLITYYSYLFIGAGVLTKWFTPRANK